MATLFGDKLKEAREKSGMTLKKLGEMTELSVSYLSKVEQGHIKDPGGFSVVKLAMIFEWSVEELDDCFHSQDWLSLNAEISELEKEFSTSGPLAKSEIRVMRMLVGDDFTSQLSYLKLLQNWKARSV